MNVYDFDKTIYDGDSTIDLYFYCLKKKPSVFFRCFFTQFSGAVKYKTGRISKEQFKERFLSFLKYFQKDDDLLNGFWSENKKKIKQWYLKKKTSDDVIISASPEFLLRPVCDELGVSLIASVVDRKTGKFSGNNCRGAEKVKRFRESYPDEQIDEFYTDSKSDMPMAKISEKAFLVKRKRITLMEWNDK